MIYMNIKTTFLRCPEYIGSEPVERATWLNLLAFCCEQENGGRIQDCKNWKCRQWQQTCGVTLDEVTARSPLFSWDGDDLVVIGYPQENRDYQTRRTEANRFIQLRSTRERVFGRDNFTCMGCGLSSPTGRGLAIDHIKPIKRGGGNALRNLQTLCVPCNSRKGAR